MVRDLIKVEGVPPQNPNLGIITDSSYKKDGKNHKLDLQLLVLNGQPNPDILQFQYSQTKKFRLKKIEESLLELFKVKDLNQLLGKGAWIERDTTGKVVSFNTIV